MSILGHSFAALNDMEEMGQDDVVAVAESHSEASAASQALLPMEIDEEQAGDSSQAPSPSTTGFIHSL